MYPAAQTQRQVHAAESSFVLSVRLQRRHLRRRWTETVTCINDDPALLVSKKP